MKMKIRLTTITFLLLFLTSAHAIDIKTPVTYTALLMAADFAVLVAIDDTEDDISFENFKDTWSDPAPRDDDDSFWYNLVLHPLMGSETYLRAREGDWGVGGSIAFTFGASLTWEYLVESWTEHPSKQDLLYTTGLGWILGEIRYNLKQNCIKKNKSYFWVDPIWATLEHMNFKITHKNNKPSPAVEFTFLF